MTTYNFENLNVPGIVTSGQLVSSDVYLSSAPLVNTDTNLLIYSAGNGGRIDQRTDGVFLNNTQTITGDKTFTGSSTFQLDTAGSNMYKMYSSTGANVTAMTGASGTISSPISGNFTYGMVFTTTSPIIVTAFKFQSALWGSALTLRQAGIWNSANSLIFSINITQTTLSSGYYVEPSFFLFLFGTYTIGFFCTTGDTFYTTNTGMTFDSRITSISGVFSNGLFSRPFNITLSNYIPCGNFEFSEGEINVTVQSNVLTLYKPIITELTSLGTSDSTLNGKVQRIYVSGTTSGAATTILLGGQTIPNNSSITVDIIINGYVTSGTSATNSLNIHHTTKVKNVASTYTVGTVLQNLISGDTGPLLSATVDVTAGSDNYSTSVTGVLGENIRWSGTVTNYY